MHIPRRIVRIALALIALGVVALAAGIGALWLRHNREVILPAPAGPYPVGRVEYDWTDAGRPDPLAANPNQPRALNVWIWYPARRSASLDQPAPYLPPAWVAAHEQAIGVGALLTQNLARVQGHSIAHPALADDKAAYPLLVMQPGLGPAMPDYTTIAETLASYGYIVAGGTPTESASVVAFNDGRVVEGTPQGNVSETADITETQRVLGGLIQVWADDDEFVLDQMTRLNLNDPDDRFTGRIDLNAVGALGHSFGGATAAEFCRRDARCKAGADLDGYLYGDVAQGGLRRPFLFLWSEPPDRNDSIWRQAMETAGEVYKQLPRGSAQATIKGTRHFNFADYAVEFAPVIRLQDGLGPIDGSRGLQIITAYVRGFFDEALRHTPNPLLDAPASPYPEVQIERR